jgi:hypothetical protein
MLVFSAADFEDFLVLRPEASAAMEPDLDGVVRFLAGNGWPWRWACPSRWAPTPRA